LSRISLTVNNDQHDDDPHDVAHLDHVKVDLPVVACSAGDKSIAIALLLRRVHRRDLLTRHPGLK